MFAQVKCVETFKEFYQTKTKHRKLTWIYSLGTCNIVGKFEPKTIELIVTTYQVIFKLYKAQPERQIIFNVLVFTSAVALAGRCIAVIQFSR